MSVPLLFSCPEYSLSPISFLVWLVEISYLNVRFSIKLCFFNQTENLSNREKTQSERKVYLVRYFDVVETETFDSVCERSSWQSPDWMLSVKQYVCIVWGVGMPQNQLHELCELCSSHLQ